MGIYDRDYVFNQRPRGFGGLTVTGWLLVINIAVFVIGFALTRSKTGVPVLTAEVTSPEVAKADRDYRLSATGQPASREDTRTPGTLLFRHFYDANGNVVPKTGAEYLVFDVLTGYGHFSTRKAFAELEVWRLVTFQFLHADLLHLGFNMLGLWMFGRMVEEHLGRSKYLAFYLMCGVCGGLMYLVLNGLGWLAIQFNLPRLPFLLFNRTTTPLVGASAGVFGVIMAAAYIAPNLRVQLLLPPIPMKLRTMAYFYVGLAIFIVLTGGRNAGGEAAHIGGAIGGFFFIRRSHLLRDFFGEFTMFSRKDRAGRIVRPGGAPAARAAPPRRPDDEELNREVDAILDKVAREGIGSLTEKEKAILRRATDLQRRA